MTLLVRLALLLGLVRAEPAEPVFTWQGRPMLLAQPLDDQAFELSRGEAP